MQIIQARKVKIGKPKDHGQNQNNKLKGEQLIIQIQVELTEDYAFCLIEGQGDKSTAQLQQTSTVE